MMDLNKGNTVNSSFFSTKKLGILTPNAIMLLVVSTRKSANLKESVRRFKITSKRYRFRRILRI